jgi:hypothetical protein
MDSALLPYSFAGQVTIARRHTRFIERDLPKRCEALHGLLDLACGLAV